MIPRNPLFKTGNELQYIGEALKNGHICGDGKFSKLCETWLETTLQAQRVLLVNSCTGALEMAAILADIQNGDEVIMPSFTFTSTATAFVQRGATPVFVDVDPVTCNIAPGELEQAITSKTKAIVVVHYAGYPCQMSQIMAIAKFNNLMVIEDAAQALLGRDEGRYLGTIGHMGCLSFHESKNVQCGEGGALLLNCPELISRAEIIREKGTNRSAFFRGQVDKYTWVDTGSSYVLSELNAAFLWAQLEVAHWITEQKIRLHQVYYEALAPLQTQGTLSLAPHPVSYPGSAHIFYLQTQTLEERTKLIKHLHSNGVLAYFHYIPLHSSPAGLKYGRCLKKLPNTDRIGDCLLRLPIYPHMSHEDFLTIVSSVVSFYR